MKSIVFNLNNTQKTLLIVKKCSDVELPSYFVIERLNAISGARGMKGSKVDLRCSKSVTYTEYKWETVPMGDYNYQAALTNQWYFMQLKLISYKNWFNITLLIFLLGLLST